MAGVTSSPRLSGHGVGGVSVSTERLSVNPGLGDGIGGLALGQAKELGDNSGGSDLDEHDVVQPDLVVRVFKSEHTLNFMGLDHSLEHFVDGWDLSVTQRATGTVGPRDPVGNSEDTTQVVGWMTPFGGQPAVIVVQPPDHGADVESAIDGVELIWGTEDLGAIGDGGAGHNGPKKFCAFLEFQGLQTTTDGIEENPASSIKLR